MKLFRNLYDWILHWADTPYGQPALFMLALVEASCFPVPPDILLIALSLSRPRRSFRFAAICLVGSTIGGILGYWLGVGAWDLLSRFFYEYIPGFTPEIFTRVQNLFSEYGFWAVFTAGFTPIPYKIFTIGAGVFQINFLVFVFASILSRGARFFLVGALIRHYGEPVKVFIDRYFNLLSILFVILLVGGFFAVKRFFH
ncbi:YqaA family protein [Geothermobacter hydrogeniphilus]|uniref:Cytochrome B n=1 Tax=Geothermobacter hydrogeniphilus TaxID=1969733 RepID=A0A1X0YET0_9BACT|nr:YqaA family protein [Geothermobacter hydrogeniphilus]ORJ63593.1 cytochrome B [Geothermobacter hydrogeniphilus]